MAKDVNRGRAVRIEWLTHMATATPPKPAATPTSFDRTLASATSTIKFRETLHLAMDSFRASKVRFLLTMLGMVIGSASIILTATLGLTGTQYALQQLNSIGPNKIEMQYGGGSIIGPDNTSTPDNMTREDLDAGNCGVVADARGSRGDLDGVGDYEGHDAAGGEPAV
jgi:hypothetical protein